MAASPARSAAIGGGAGMRRGGLREPGGGAAKEWRAPGPPPAPGLAFFSGPPVFPVAHLRPGVLLSLPPPPAARGWGPGGVMAGAVRLFGGGGGWVLDAGIGSFAACRWDYIKHNFIFSSLLQGKLPILIDGGAAGRVPLSYYFAYYIVPVRLSEGL